MGHATEHGNTIHNTVAAHRIATSQPQIDMAAQQAESPRRTVRPAHGSRSSKTAAISPVTGQKVAQPIEQASEPTRHARMRAIERPEHAIRLVIGPRMPAAAAVTQPIERRAVQLIEPEAELKVLEAGMSRAAAEVAAAAAAALSEEDPVDTTDQVLAPQAVGARRAWDPGAAGRAAADGADRSS